MIKKIHYREIEGNSVNYYILLGFLGTVIALALAATYYMEHNGHHVTGMTNQIVWGIPHVFAVFLIVAASGALNVASIASVFGKTAYKPLAPLSGLVAIALLVGGLCVLVLDLGRPDRLIVAMTAYNFKSIFAWNIILYNGFIAIVAVYLWMMMEHRMNKYSKVVGFVAFTWRLILTTGTGSIFGFLVARQGYDAAIMAPMFILMSFSFGMAIFILILMASYAGTGRPLGSIVVQRLKNLLGVFVAAVLLIVAIYHLTNLYATEHHEFEQFILLSGGIYTFLFWVVQILLGSLIPLFLFYSRVTKDAPIWTIIGCILVIVGGLAQMYGIIIGGQAFPLNMFPGFEVSSSFFDGVVSQYTPSLPEIALGIGGVAIALIMVTIAIKILRFLPLSLDNALADPHHKAKPVTEAEGKVAV
ncbi:MAG: polysulfide reductase NrfD [Gammaproteobacteria bacterium]|nr:polysulfide reductase NrfD [Gammaproteobacteria bacterium]